MNFSFFLLIFLSISMGDRQGFGPFLEIAGELKVPLG